MRPLLSPTLLSRSLRILRRLSALAAITTFMAMILSVVTAPLFNCYRYPRPEVSRTRSDMRSLATALEAYFADFGTYPQAEALVRWSENPDAVYSMRGGRLFAVGKRLTTPVAYIGQRFYFEDVFADASKAPFGYLARADGWILISAGPDKDYDIDPLRHYSPGPDAEKAPALLLRTYDPTNGSISAGDIWRVKQ